MNKQIIFVVVIVAVLVAGGVYLYTNQTTTTPESPTDSSPVSGEPFTNPPTEPPPTSDESTTTTTTTTTVSTEVAATVIYRESGYSPSTVTIPVGSAVTFTNATPSSEMWPASAMHPTHAVYPTTGGCIGSTFDSCTAIPSGGSWTFTFDEVGTWNYHDHINASKFGKVIVQ